MRRRLLAFGAASACALALAACGTSDPAAERNEAEGETRTIEHAMGSSEIPAEPQRVVVLDTDKIDTALSLGVTPVGAARAGETELPTYLGDLSGVTVVGTTSEPDLEAIEALEPDLILGSKFRQEAFYDELNAIAPTVFTEQVGVTWKENFLLDGDALGKGEEAKQLLDDYEARAAEFGASLGDAISTEVSLVRFMPDQIRVYGPDSFSGIVVGDVGLARPELQQLADADDKRFAEVSAEELDTVGGDVVFYCAYGADGASMLADYTGGELWQSIAAVQGGKAYEVDDEVWMTGIGVTAAGMILDDLEQYLQA
ncbi:ABC transporter substrate-binding protein [Glycomyces tritici]|uniref:Iron-siderophore ABC transporter substrate-binding protein n=1 Tax=Glycomyces tritici TaxID=2665176 RepID=A0ABT7YK58_9ACTN|nr:iron-siderophore ABC transporter substrate-binding protein [Glycomyces tritici]MDN3239022.1 iron-siderophore ABC transporter substrate-binding protein [Glycomyces tritici]MDN3240184.1 iron-siderophore ABC transporter substrate-binding protein [Glycomyces tritici]